MAHSENQAHTDDVVADALDHLARSANRLRRMIPNMTIEQLQSISDSCPLPQAEPSDTLLDLDTWAVVAAASLRETVIDLAG